MGGPSAGSGTTGCEDHQNYLRDVATFQPRASLSGHTDSIIFLAFHPSGKLLASGGYGRTTRLWDTWAGKQVLSAPEITFGFDGEGKRLAYDNAPSTGIWELAADDCS